MPKMQLQYELDASPHPSLPGHYLIPVSCPNDGEYSVYIANDKARFYTDATLPDCIKAQLGLIRGRGLGYGADQIYGYGDDQIYYTAQTYDKEVPEIGRQLNARSYVVVLTKKELQELDTGRTGV